MFVTAGPGLSPESVRWQLGYCHGEEHRMPQFPDDADYASGWSHGHNSVHQCSMEVSEATFFELRLRRHEAERRRTKGEGGLEGCVSDISRTR